MVTPVIEPPSLITAVPLAKVPHQGAAEKLTIGGELLRYPLPPLVIVIPVTVPLAIVKVPVAAWPPSGVEKVTVGVIADEGLAMTKLVWLACDA